MTSALDYLDVIAPLYSKFEIFYDFSEFSLVLFTGVVACIGVVFAWWALRRVTAIIMNAFRSGKLKF